LLSHLATAGNIVPHGSTDSIVWERLYDAAKRFGAVNFDRYLVLAGHALVQNTVRVAFVYYLQMKEQWGADNFLPAPVLPKTA